MPWFGDAEQGWPSAIRAFLYLLGLGWCFMGVALSADVFMGAIEHITSQKKRKFNSQTARWVTVEVWNPTVANLTLMALGSSAPEILLSAIELLGNDFYSGDLGPSTIVGSAAFNLFVIIAVCVSAIENNEVRFIKETPVYCITATCSIGAYVWLVVVLLGWSKHVVEPVEGVLTFLFFPLLIVLAYFADIGYFTQGKTDVFIGGNTYVDKEGNEFVVRQDHCDIVFGVGGQNQAGTLEGSKLSVPGWSPGIVQSNQDVKFSDGDYWSLKKRGRQDDERPTRIVAAELSKEELAELDFQVRSSMGGDLTVDQLVQVINCECQEPTSRARYRVAATRYLTGGKRLTVMDSKSPAGTQSGQRANSKDRYGRNPSKVAPIDEIESASDAPRINRCVMEFDCKKYAVLENAGHRKVVVVREGCLDHAATIHYATREGSAKPGSDYTHAEGEVTFAPGQRTQDFLVHIVDDLAFEEDEEFYIDLSEPKVEGEHNVAEIGMNHTMTIVLIDDDLPGVISFADDELHVQEGDQDRQVDVVVQRAKGSTGRVSVQYYTEDDTAHAGVDYEAKKGELVFEQGDNEKAIRLTVHTRGRYSRTDMFRVYLTDVIGGAKFDENTDGGEERCIMTVLIESQPEGQERIDNMMQRLQGTWVRAKIGHANYAEQFYEAVLVNGGSDDHEDSEDSPTIKDYILHAITLPWKVLCACIPPTDYCGGWACFCASLMLIGGITALISDLASLLGCVLTIPDEITAITFVALGTSLPDTFASQAAATADAHADASIGNVTGSNCVNVFLGLGLPWTIGSLYWTTKGRDSEWSAKYLNDLDIDPGFRETGAFIVKAGTLAFSVIVFSCLALICVSILYVRRRLFGGELGGPRTPACITSCVLVCLWLNYVILSSWYALANKPGC